MQACMCACSMYVCCVYVRMHAHVCMHAHTKQTKTTPLKQNMYYLERYAYSGSVRTPHCWVRGSCDVRQTLLWAEIGRLPATHPGRRGEYSGTKTVLMTMMMMITTTATSIIIIIIIALKGANRDCYKLFTAPRAVSSTYAQVAMRKSRATHRGLSCVTHRTFIMCKMP